MTSLKLKSLQNSVKDAVDLPPFWIMGWKLLLKFYFQPSNNPGLKNNLDSIAHCAQNHNFKIYQYGEY